MKTGTAKVLPGLGEGTTKGCEGASPLKQHVDEDFVLRERKESLRKSTTAPQAESHAVTSCFTSDQNSRTSQQDRRHLGGGFDALTEQVVEIFWFDTFRRLKATRSAGTLRPSYSSQRYSFTCSFGCICAILDRANFDSRPLGNALGQAILTRFMTKTVLRSGGWAVPAPHFMESFMFACCKL